MFHSFSFTQEATIFKTLASQQQNAHADQTLRNWATAGFPLRIEVNIYLNMCCSYSSLGRVIPRLSSCCSSPPVVKSVNFLFVTRYPLDYVPGPLFFMVSARKQRSWDNECLIHDRNPKTLIPARTKAPVRLAGCG